MRSTRRSRLLRRLVPFLAVPFVVALALPAAVADEPPPVSSTSEEHPAPVPGAPAVPDPAPSDEAVPAPAPVPAADPVPTDGPVESDVPAEASTDAPDTDSAADGASDAAEAVDPAAGPADAAALGTTDPAAMTAAAPVATADEPRKARKSDMVTICHRTNSRTNPYNQIVVSPSAAVNGHAGHTGPVFAPGVDNWGDIIPPVPPQLPDGLNWPAGREILENGCETAPPDVGPVPGASIGGAECVGTDPTVEVTVTNGADATEPAFFSILVNGTVVQRVGPIAPGESETVVLDGGPGRALEARENQTFSVAVRSAGVIIASRVITVDCAPGPPPLDIAAQLTCAGDTAQGTATVTNNGADPVEMTVTVDGTPVGAVLVVEPGATETGSVDLSAYEDQTVTVDVLADGLVVATYIVTPDCVAPEAAPRVSVAGQVCPPPSATVTLANEGDPDSRVVFTIRVNGGIVQRTAPVFGGNTTTIVGDLRRYEDQTVTVGIRANGELLGQRTIRVDCEQVSIGPGIGGADPSGSLQPGGGSTSVLPSVGADVSPAAMALGLGLLAVGSALVFAGGAKRGGRAARTPLG